MAEYFICHSITGMFWNLISLQEEPAEQVECHIDEQKPEEMYRAYDKSTSILQSRYVNGSPKKLTKRGACCYQLLNYFQLVITYMCMYIYIYLDKVNRLMLLYGSLTRQSCMRKLGIVVRKPIATEFYMRFRETFICQFIIHWYAVVYPPILHVMELHVLKQTPQRCLSRDIS